MASETDLRRPVSPSRLRQMREATEARNAAFRDPSPEAAEALCRDLLGIEVPGGQGQALALLHHWRLRWLDATDEMIAESTAHLKDSPFRDLVRGPEALTPSTRDARRVMVGKLPLSLKVARA